MPIVYSLSSIIKTVDLFTGKAIEDVNIKYSKGNCQIIYKGRGIFAVINWNKKKVDIIAQKKGYDAAKATLEYDGNTEKIIALRRQNADTVNIECRIDRSIYKSGENSVLYGVASYEGSSRIIRSSPKSSFSVKIDASSQLDEQYRQVFIEGSGAVYTVKKYELNSRSYILDKPLDNDIDAGSAITVLNSMDVKGQSFNIEVLKSEYLLSKNLSIALFYNNKFYQSFITERNNKYTAVFGRR